jgi:hypothetical protein
MTTPWEVPRDWEGETVAVLASGPSMSLDVAEFVRGKCRVIAVSNQGIPNEVGGVLRPALAPWADMLYASDLKWWMHYKAHALAFEGLKVTIRTVLPFKEVLSLEQSRNVPFDPRPTHLVSGGNSGYQAVHIAAQRGAGRILLCGFDMRHVGNCKHWFGAHSGKLNTAMNYKQWIDNFSALAADLTARGVRLVNCTPRSALRGIPFTPLEEAFHA